MVLMGLLGHRLLRLKRRGSGLLLGNEKGDLLVDIMSLLIDINR
jgi:hypothetical protein